MTNTKTFRPVTSIADLSLLASTYPEYKELALSAARNLGGTPKTLTDALNVLRMNAMETDSEEGVVDEINFCR